MEMKIDDCWTNLGDDPITSKDWVNLIATIDQDGEYSVHLTAVFERLNPVGYEGNSLLKVLLKIT